MLRIGVPLVAYAQTLDYDMNGRMHRDYEWQTLNINRKDECGRDYKWYGNKLLHVDDRIRTYASKAHMISSHAQ